ncbi:MAG TPA: HAMP domain-containing sensor histidine kinase, partial [Chitinophagaceae bacterium]|nr:HAMP domain-containing sensor histidine kinase [Chitinophagaceae bacterium]
SYLLDMSQVESGKIQLNLQVIQPSALLNKAVESVQNVAKEKNIAIKRELSDNLPSIKADPDKTVWVLNNFLTNAIRYSSTDSAVIARVLIRDNSMQFTVQDFGKGIAPEYKDKIFDRYFRVPGTKEGTGLGLAICKEFIEAQGGKIWIESDLGSGSRFSFSFPVTT